MQLLDYREFVSLTHIPQTPGLPGVCESKLDNSKIPRQTSNQLFIFTRYLPTSAYYSPFFFLVCGVWVALPLHHKLLDYREFVGHGYYHALRVCGGWVVLPLYHKLKNHVSTHAPQTPGVPGVCGGGVALPISHKLKKKFENKIIMAVNNNNQE